ncbi:MAG TPA: tetratricopeptide repeat protein [Anaerohalosphaeraceae bacterium]|nr:tetratricopeptide repeat protein [Phycisphaerae bacterium]HOK96547.1 tetratricopeptide repeat protein [Anaerohalosphaeraceae bacterium]HOL32000.1 tetratricopeptide repeat protein [Anaerohalosphaeraceae bacterium]HOM76515.1 tetratricopeptide repeat protein [Anaerohalosphaeraceae bacterium]HPC65035.1 tetratricopeptide repeat protein [Anaerohalosphaeraceae bacterium]
MLDWQDEFDTSHEWDQAEELAIEAHELYENGQMQKAMEKLDLAIRQRPEHGQWQFNMALTLDALGEYEKAIAFYERAAELAPGDIEILNCLGVDCTRTGLYDQAIDYFEQIEQIDPNFEPAYCNRIIVYTEMEQHDRAEQMFYTAQQINPDCPLCFYNIGNSLFTRGQYEKAIWCWDKCASLDPAHPQIHYRIAQACWISGQGCRARQEFIAELRRNPADLDVILDFGLFLLESGDLIAAREKFTRILEFDESFTLAHFYLGEVYRIQGAEEQAFACYRRALQGDPSLVGPRFRLAELCLKRGQPCKAVSLLRDEFEQGIEDIEVLLAMGWMFLRADTASDAANCFVQILNEAGPHNEAFYGLAMTLAAHADYEGALHCVEQALCIGPCRPDWLLAAAWLCCKLRKWPQAEECIRKCRQLQPNRQPWESRCRRLLRFIRCSQFIDAVKAFLKKP